MQVNWQRCEPARPACAVVASGALAHELATLARTRVESTDVELQIVQTMNETVVIGATTDLPWLDGVQYLGVLDGTNLLCSVHLEPDVPAPLLSKAVVTKARPSKGPFAIVHDALTTGAITVVPLVGAQLPAVTP